MSTTGLLSNVCLLLLLFADGSFAVMLDSLPTQTSHRQRQLSDHQMCVDVNLAQPTGRVITRERDCRRACKSITNSLGITKCAAFHYNRNGKICNLYEVNGVGNASMTMCGKVPSGSASISRGRFSCERNMDAIETFTLSFMDCNNRCQGQCQSWLHDHTTEQCIHFKKRQQQTHPSDRVNTLPSRRKIRRPKDHLCRDTSVMLNEAISTQTATCPCFNRIDKNRFDSHQCIIKPNYAKLFDPTTTSKRGSLYSVDFKQSYCQHHDARRGMDSVSGISCYDMIAGACKDWDVIESENETCPCFPNGFNSKEIHGAGPVTYMCEEGSDSIKLVNEPINSDYPHIMRHYEEFGADLHHLTCQIDDAVRRVDKATASTCYKLIKNECSQLNEEKEEEEKEDESGDGLVEIPENVSCPCFPHGLDMQSINNGFYKCESGIDSVEMVNKPLKDDEVRITRYFEEYGANLAKATCRRGNSVLRLDEATTKVCYNLLQNGCFQVNQEEEKEGIPENDRRCSCFDQSEFDHIISSGHYSCKAKITDTSMEAVLIDKRVDKVALDRGLMRKYSVYMSADSHNAYCNLEDKRSTLNSREEFLDCYNMIEDSCHAPAKKVEGVECPCYDDEQLKLAYRTIAREEYPFTFKFTSQSEGNGDSSIQLMYGDSNFASGYGMSGYGADINEVYGYSCLQGGDAVHVLKDSATAWTCYSLLEDTYKSIMV